MTATLDRIVRPDVEYSVETGHRKIGLGVGAIALMIGMVVAGLGIYAASLVGTAGEEETLGRVLAVAFGLNTTALVMLKAGIAIILVGILVTSGNGLDELDQNGLRLRCFRRELDAPLCGNLLSHLEKVALQAVCQGHFFGLGLFRRRCSGRRFPARAIECCQSHDQSSRGGDAEPGEPGPAVVTPV